MRESFYRTPYAFAKKLFTAAKSDRLDIAQEELKAHLRKTYSDSLKEVPLPPMDGIPPLEESETPFRAGGLRLYEAREFIRQAHACCAQGGMASPSSSARIAQLSCNSSSAFYKEPGGRDTSHKNGAWLMGVWIPKEENLIGFLSPNFSPQRQRQDFLRSNCQANDIIPPPWQVRQNVSPEGWHLRVPWLPGACSNDLEFLDDRKAREERTPRRMAWPGQCLWICASQLHQVCIEVHPHPREGGWHLNTVLRECLHAFHHYQLYDGLASIGSRHHDWLRWLTSAVLSCVWR